MTDEVKLDIDNKKFVAGMEAAAKSADELFKAVSKLSSGGGAALDKFMRSGDAAAAKVKTVRATFKQELQTAVGNLAENAENSANFFSATNRRVAKSFEDSTVHMLANNKKFTLEYFNTWKGVGQSVPNILKPVYADLLAAQKSASAAAISTMKDEAATAKMLGDARRAAEAKAEAVFSAGRSQVTAANKARDTEYNAWWIAALKEREAAGLIAAKAAGSAYQAVQAEKIAADKAVAAAAVATMHDEMATAKMVGNAKRAEAKSAAAVAITSMKDEAATAKMEGDARRASQQRLLASMKQQTSQMWAEKARIDKEEQAKSLVSFKNYNAALDANMAAQAATFKTLAAARSTSLATSAQTQVRGATLAPVGAFSDLSSGKITLPTQQVTGFTGALKHMNTTMKQTVVDGNDLHSAMRGLASGFNLLWLTWGNLAPLFAGAAISFGVKSVVTLGSQVQHTFETIKVLSGETAESVKGLNDQMISIAENGPIGPLAVAEAMKTLSLAGLSASQVSASIKDVLNFAIAGDVDIKKASDAMTTVATAFGISAEAYNVVGDAIAKTAAVSKSSVEDIGEAFKTSSVLHKQYGVSLTDVGVGLAALANLGIKGSAAGTALRNMYVDLSGRTKEVAQTLKAAGIELRDQTTGNFKNIVQMVEEYDAALSKLKGKAQKDFLQATLSERGGKPIVELRDMLHRQAEEAGTTISNKLQELQREIEDRAGFAIMAAAKLQLTPLNQMKSVVSTMQVELVRAFDAASPAITAVSAQLKGMFRSDEFRAGLENLITTFGRLAIAVTENIGPLTKLLGLYVAFSVGKGVLQVATSLTSTFGLLAIATTSTSAAMTAAGTATVATTRTMTAAAVAATGLSRAMAFLGPIGAVLAAGATAWQLWAFFQDKANDGVKKAATDGNYDTYLDYLKQETARIRENTEALRLNISVEELRNRKKQEAASKDTQASIQAPISKAQADVATAVAALRKYETDHPESDYRARVDKARLANEVATAQAALRKAQNDAYIKRTQLQLQEAEVLAVTRAQAAEQARKDAETLAAQPRGTGDFTQTDAASKAAAERQARVAAATQIAELRDSAKHYDSLNKLAEDAYKNEAILLDSQHKNKLITEGDYQAQVLANAKAHEDKLLDISETAQVKAAKEYLQARSQINKTLEGADRDSAMQKLDSSYKSFLDRVNSDDTKRASDAILRIAIAANDSAGRIKAMGLEVDKFLAEDANHLAAGAVEIGEAFDKYTAAGMEAAAKQAEKYSNQIDKVQLALTDLTTTIEYLNERGLTAQADKFKESQTQLQELLDKLNSRKSEATATAFKNAVDKLKAADFRKLTSSIAEAIVQGGVHSGPRLREILEEEFLSKPFRVLIEAAISDVSTGGISKLLSDGGAFMGQVATIGNQLKGAYDMLTSPTSWFTREGFASNIASNVGSFGSNMGELGAWTQSGWMKTSGNWLADNSAAIGKYAEMAGSALGYISALQAADKGKWGNAIGTGIGTYFGGPIGATIGGAIGGWVDEAFGGGHEYTTGTGITGTFGGSGFLYDNSGFGGQRYQEWRNDGSSGFLGIGASGSSSGTNYSTLDAATDKVLGDQYKILLSETVGFAKALALPVDTLKGYQQDIKVALGSDVEANKKAIADMFTGVANKLAAIVVSPEYIREGEGAADTLARLATNLTTVNASLDFMNTKLLEVGHAGGDAASKLVDGFGGTQAYQQATDAYYKEFFSEDERKAAGTKALNKVFDGLSVGGPFGAGLPRVTVGQTSREQYRALIEAQDLTTDSGRKTYTTLLQLSSSFAALTPAVEAVTNKISDATKRLMQDAGALQVELLSAKGDTAGAKALQRQIDTFDLTPVEIAVYDYNQSLRDQIAAVNAAASAAEQYRSTLAGLASTGGTLQADLLEAQGDTTGAKALRRRQGLDSLLEGVVGQAEKDRIVAAYDYNQSLRDQIEAVNAAKQAQEESQRAATQAAADAARAAEQLKAAWQSVTDTIFDEVKRIRDLMGQGAGQQSLAQAQAKYAITLAQAQAGDQNAAKLLPDLSKTMLNLAEAQATTLVQLRALQGQTAGSLEALAKQYASTYGLQVPQFAVGTNVVPQDMLAVVHKGEAIVPAAYNPALAGDDWQQTLVEEIRTLRRQVATLQLQLDSSNANTKRTADILNRVTRGGDAMQVSSEGGAGVTVVGV